MIGHIILHRRYVQTTRIILYINFILQIGIIGVGDITKDSR